MMEPKQPKGTRHMRTKEERQIAVNKIIDDVISRAAEYEGFIAECVEKYVSTWSSRELDSWFGIEGLNKKELI